MANDPQAVQKADFRSQTPKRQKGVRINQPGRVVRMHHVTATELLFCSACNPISTIALTVGFGLLMAWIPLPAKSPNELLLLIAALVLLGIGGVLQVIVWIILAIVYICKGETRKK